MCVTLAAAIISLLPAAVGFHTHKDNVQWHYGGEKKEKKKKGSAVAGKTHCDELQQC